MKKQSISLLWANLVVIMTCGLAVIFITQFIPISTESNVILFGYGAGYGAIGITVGDIIMYYRNKQQLSKNK